MTDTFPSVVIDCGSGFTKVGFSGEDAPRSIFPTMVIHSQKKTNHHQNTTRDEEVINRHPIERGIIKDWDAMEHIWNYIFCNELKIGSEDCCVMLTEVSLNPKFNREKMTSIMFETFKVPGLYVAGQPALSLFASGRINGLVLEVGDGITQSVPLYEGHAYSMQCSRLDLSGNELTDYMMQLLLENGFNFNSNQRNIVKDIKEKLCYVALDYDNESKKMASYELPDGNKISIGNERFKCTEILFQPEYIGGLDHNGIHQLAFRSISLCDIDIRNEFYSNILLSGGSTMFEGLSERLSKEMKELAPPLATIKVIAPPERSYSTWIGGSILSSMDHIQNMWISPWEFEEYGPGIVHRKSFV